MSGIVLESIDDTRQLLCDWGKWAAANTMVKGLRKPAESLSVVLDDETGVMIDKMISDMGGRDEAAKAVLLLSFVRHETHREIALSMAINVALVKGRIDSAVYWLDGKLHDFYIVNKNN